jgi:L-ribulose-5-phosphate 3-epimerase
MNPRAEINYPSRRSFLSQIALASAALPLAQLAGTAHAAEPKKGKKAKQAAPAASSGSPLSPTVFHVFAKPLQIFSYAETASLIAEAGFGGIDYAVRPAGHVVPEKVKEDLPRAVEAAQKAGLKVDMITTGITDPRDPLTEPLLQTAVKLGVKIYRFGVLQYDAKLPVMESLQKHKAAVKELESINRGLGIHGCFQNHAGVRVGGPIWDLYELVKDVDPRWVGVQYDIRHATAEGGQSWPLALKLVAPWIKCTDLKDFMWQQSPGKGVIENVPVGQGIVSFDAYFKLLRELNIAGPTSVHFEYPPFERAPQVPENQKRSVFLAAMKKDLAAIKAFRAKQEAA